MAEFRLTCGVCQTEEKVEGLCHHCSRPLCAEDQIHWRDGAFSGRPGALHCPDCLLKYHIPAGSFPILGTMLRAFWFNSSLFRSLLNSPPSAQERRSLLGRLRRQPGEIAAEAGEEAEDEPEKIEADG